MPTEELTIERLKEIFVTRQECNLEMKNLEDKITPLTVRLAVIEQQQKLNNWLTALIAGGVVTALIKLFLGA
jgi:hypothetical protein